MSQNKTISMTVPGPQDFALQALGTVGMSDRSMGYWSHELQGIFSGLLPEWIAAAAFMPDLLKMRDDFSKKKQK